MVRVQHIALAALLAVLTLHCSRGATCGPGTVEVDGECVPSAQQNNVTDAGTNDVSNQPDDIGAHDQGVGANNRTDAPSGCDPQLCPPLLNADPSCDDRQCVYTCRDGFDDCDGTLANGCEADLESPDSCGNCDNACPSIPTTDPVCIDGECNLTCEAGRADCDGSLASGCESNLASVLSCGDCSTSCAQRQVCASGTCQDARPLWAYEVKGTTNIWSAAALDDGAVVVGEFFGVLDLDIAGLSAARDNFIVRLDANGEVAWAWQIFTESEFGLRVDKVRVHGDTIFIVGEASGETFFGSVDTGIDTPGDDRDAFVATISTDGTWGWARTYGTAGVNERARDIAVASNGELFVGMDYGAATDIGLGELPPVTGSFGGNGVVVRMGPSGQPMAQLPLVPDDSRGVVRTELAINASDELFVGFENNSEVVTVADLTVTGFGAVLGKLDLDLNPIWLRGLSRYVGTLRALSATTAAVYSVNEFEPAAFVGPDLVAVSVSGITTWIRKIGATTTIGPIADSADRIFTVSRIPGATRYDALFFAYDRDGRPIWSSRISDSQASHMSVAPNDHRIATLSASEPLTLAGTPVAANRNFVVGFPPLP